MNGGTRKEDKIVRDPLYGFIEVGDFEDRLLDSPLFQRLCRIKQLAHTYIVFPSATHTRLEHSLGTMYVAGRIAAKLGFDEPVRRAVRAAALLHDIGHGPFSHVFEDPIRRINGPDFSHEEVTLAMIKSDPTIATALGDLAGEVHEIIAGNRGILSSIISSSLDADKMDYLRRDSYHTGVAYGVFDIERVLRCIAKVPDPDEAREYLAIETKGMDALESYRLARYSMHRQVYEHKTRLAADDMFIRAVNAAFDEGVLVPAEWKVTDTTRLLESYAKYDDHSLVHAICERSNGLAKRLIDDLRNRRLLKEAYSAQITAQEVPDWVRRKNVARLKTADIAKAEAKIAGDAGIDPTLVVVHLQSTRIRLYEKFEQTLEGDGEPILVKRKDGSSEQMEQLSPIHPDPDQVRHLHVFCPESNKEAVRKAAEERFGRLPQK